MLRLFDPFLHIFFTTFTTFSRVFLCGKIRILPFIWENYQKYYWNPIYQHFSNYQQIIDIEIRLPDIISDLKEISISISKLPGKLSKNYRYRKKWLIADPYLLVINNFPPLFNILFRESWKGLDEKQCLLRVLSTRYVNIVKNWEEQKSQKGHISALISCPAGVLRRKLLHRNGNFIPPAPWIQTRERVKMGFRIKSGFWPGRLWINWKSSNG